jgi:hypothetical protein
MAMRTVLAMTVLGVSMLSACTVTTSTSSGSCSSLPTAGTYKVTYTTTNAGTASCAPIQPQTITTDGNHGLNFSMTGASCSESIDNCTVTDDCSKGSQTVHFVVTNESQGGQGTLDTKTGTTDCNYTVTFAKQ